MTAGATVHSGSAGRTQSLGRRLASLLEPGDVVSLAGDLGAGKTCLVKGVAEGLGVEGHVTSPTFNILVVHAGRLELAHFDLYRLEREEQLEDIDFWGTLESGGVALIEWGDRFPQALPPGRLELDFRITGDETREISVAWCGARSERLGRAWVALCGEGPGEGA